VNDRILSMLSHNLMTTDELRKALHTTRAAVVTALATLHGQGLVCIAAYKPTRSSPARLWGLGNTDAPKPKIKNQEHRNALRRERERRKRELLESIPTHPRCDIAASWITPR